MYITTSFFILNTFASSHQTETIKNLSDICNREKFVSGDFKRQVEIMAALQLAYLTIKVNIENNNVEETMKMGNKVQNFIIETDRIEKAVSLFFEKTFAQLNTLREFPDKLVEIEKGLLQTILSKDGDNTNIIEHFNKQFLPAAQLARGEIEYDLVYSTLDGLIIGVERRFPGKGDELRRILRKLKFLKNNQCRNNIGVVSVFWHFTHD